MWSYSWNIESTTFKNKYQNVLFWGPASGIFLPTTKLFPFSTNQENLGFNPLQFKIYLSKDQSFTSNFKEIDTKWENLGKSTDITKVKFDYTTDNYFASLCAAYIILSKTGICVKHFEESSDIPKVITSMMLYYV